MVSRENKNVKEILTTKIDLFTQFLKLTLMQKDGAIGDNSLEILNQIDAKKENILKEIEEIDKQREFNRIAPNEEIKPLIAQLKSLISDILKAEEEYFVKMEQEKKQISKEIQGLTKGKTMIRGYGISSHLKSGILSVKK